MIFLVCAKDVLHADVENKQKKENTFRVCVYIDFCHPKSVLTFWLFEFFQRVNFWF